MKDDKCKEYIHTYKCDKETCDRCKSRYIKAKMIAELEEKANPIYLCDKEVDSYIELSEVIEIISKYVIE